MYNPVPSAEQAQKRHYIVAREPALEEESLRCAAAAR